MNLVGYCIGNDREEFLGSIRSVPGGRVLAWVRTPGYAKVYRSRGAAVRVVRSLERSDLGPVPLYDAGEYWWVDWGISQLADDGVIA